MCEKVYELINQNEFSKLSKKNTKSKITGWVERTRTENVIKISQKTGQNNEVNKTYLFATLRLPKEDEKCYFEKVNKWRSKIQLKQKYCLKVRLSPSEKNFVICFTESPLKMMKNAFYFILKALSVLKVFKFLSWLFGHAEKTASLERDG